MKQFGFSLIELVTTLTAFGVLAMVTGPLATTALREAKNRAAIREFTAVHIWQEPPPSRSDG